MRSSRARADKSTWRMPAYYEVRFRLYGFSTGSQDPFVLANSPCGPPFASNRRSASSVLSSIQSQAIVGFSAARVNRITIAGEPRSIKPVTDSLIRTPPSTVLTQTAIARGRTRSTTPPATAGCVATPDTRIGYSVTEFPVLSGGFLAGDQTEGKDKEKDKENPDASHDSRSFRTR